VLPHRQLSLLVCACVGALACSSKGGGGGATGDSSASVLERNKHPSRDGAFVQPTLTKAAAATFAPDTTFAASFTGAVWASPLYLENGPGGKGAFYAVTTGNDVYAFDETTGAVVTGWPHNIGSSPTANGVSCGSIHPLGIISTPVIDASSRTIYVAGAIGTTSIARHELHALSVDDGSEKSGWPVDISTITAGSLAFMPPPQNQRSALSLVGGVVYVAYGGHVGDCGAYHGWVVGINAQDPTKKGGWATGGQGEGIWAPGGMASDGNGVVAITGNRTGGGSSTHQDSEEVVRVTGFGTRADAFYPVAPMNGTTPRWQAMDSQDADLGANQPVYVELPGATPSKMFVAISKDGHMYLLDAASFGGADGAKVDFMVASGAMSIHTAPAAYRTAQGLYVVFSTDGGAICPSGSAASGKVVISVLIPPGNPPAPQVKWCAPLSGPTTGPIATTTDGTSEAVVWFMNNGALNGVDGDTGAMITNGGGGTCSNVRQWISPIAVKGRIVVGGDNHLCSWSAH
jgi:hypothetical protein